MRRIFGIFCLFAISYLGAVEPLVIILMGPPAAGKGTQAAVLSKKLLIPAISTGDLLRENLKKGTALGKEAQEYMNKGQLVPDALVLQMVFDRISQHDAQKGYLLDGFPRTINQAEAYETKVAGTVREIVINIDIPDDVAIARIVERSKEQNRADDTTEIAKERLKVYREQTAPLIGYFGKKMILHTVNGEESDQEVTKKIMAIVSIEEKHGS